MTMTEKDLWLYRNPEYKEVHWRLKSVADARRILLDEIAGSPATPAQHRREAALSARHKAIRLELRELRERLMAAHSAEGKK